jgi:hypothetical protein
MKKNTLDETSFKAISCLGDGVCLFSMLQQMLQRCVTLARAPSERKSLLRWLDSITEKYKKLSNRLARRASEFQM